MGDEGNLEPAQRLGAEVASEGIARRWLFGVAEFDERRVELRVGGEPVKLDRKDLEVLQELLRHAGEVVTKQELLEAAWPGRIVTENSLTQCIKNIRAALGDAAHEMVKTAHGYGYRLTVPVRVEAARALNVPARLGLKRGDHPPLRPQWSLTQQLGAGGQGEVWLGRHDKLGEQRVFKFALDAGGLGAIKREIAIYGLLRKELGERKDLAHVLDWNVEEAPYFIELEYAAGGNLEAWVHARGGLDRIPQPERLEIIARIADALAAAHSLGVLHKDLKPSNVLIEEAADGPRAKLTDFGSGSILDPARLAGLGLTLMDLTQSMARGDMPATFMYLAPEVVAGQPATVQADIYSLGVMLYQMVIGDFRQPLPPDWRQRVGDPLLCEDIGAAIGDEGPRLADAAALAKRLRSLDERWRQRQAARTEKERLERDKQAADERARLAELAVVRLRTRRNWMLTALSTLIVGFALSLGLYLEARRARNEATAAAASSQAVADYLSKDLFAQVGAKPLRDFTVTELVQSASAGLDRRSKELPEVAAQLHAALGNAALKVEDYELAERQLDQALTSFEASGNGGSEAAASVAAQLLIFIKTRILQVPEFLPRYERILGEAQARLGASHPQVLTLREAIATTRFWAGDWKHGADEMRSLVQARTAAKQPEYAVALAEARLGQMLVLLGDFAGAEEITRSALQRLRTDPKSPPLAFAEAHLHRVPALAYLEQFQAATHELALAEELLRPWAITDEGNAMLSVHSAQGLLELRQGHWTAAIAILEKTILQMADRDWNKRSDATAESRSWLAEAYARGGHPEKALRELQGALRIAESNLGSRHPITQRIRIQLADFLRVRDPAEASRLLASVDAGVISGLGEDHPYAAERYRVEGLLSLQRGARDSARGALREAARIYTARYGTQHSVTRRAKQELASVER